MKITFDNITLELTPSGNSYRAMLGDRAADVEILRTEDGMLELLIDDQRVRVYVSVDGPKRWVTINGQTEVLTKTTGVKRSGAGHDHASELTAPMPGVIRAVNVGEGEPVTKGQTLLVLEAMKMEIRVQAPVDGVVKKLFVKQGQTVEREQMLIEIK